VKNEKKEELEVEKVEIENTFEIIQVAPQIVLVY
jgi:hypothetical protein